MDNQSQVRVSGDTTTDKRMDGGHVKQFRQQAAHVRKGQRSETPPPILQAWEPAITGEVIVLRLWLADCSDSRDASLLYDLGRMRDLKFPFPFPGWSTATQALKLLGSLRSLQHRSV